MRRCRLGNIEGSEPRLVPLSTSWHSLVRVSLRASSLIPVFLRNDEVLSLGREKSI